MIIDAFAEPNAVLVDDEIGYVKNTRNRGVQSQHSGAAGLIEGQSSSII